MKEEVDDGESIIELVPNEGEDGDVFFIDPAKKKVNSLVPNKFDVNWTSNTPSPNTQYGRRRI